MVELVVAADAGWLPDVLAAVRAMTFAAFGDRFDEHDWEHTFGGVRAVALDAGVPVATGAVVPRTLLVGDRPVDAGYVEGVATRPDRQGGGLGTRVMAALADVVRAQHELGALSTSATAFYEQLGWERWQGPTYVRHDDGRLERTPDEDAGIMVLRQGTSAGLDRTQSLTCEGRPGDDW